MQTRTRMPTKWKLQRHIALSLLLKGSTQKLPRANTPTPPSWHHTQAHSSTTPTSSSHRKMLEWFIKPFDTWQTNQYQTESTKNRTSHRPHHTDIHTPENNADKPSNDPSPREHSNGRMHTTWTSNRHPYIHIKLHEKTSHQIHNSQQNHHTNT